CKEPPHLPETLENAVCALGLALGILGIMAGTVLCVKARQGGEGGRRRGARSWQKHTDSQLPPGPWRRLQPTSTDCRRPSCTGPLPAPSPGRPSSELTQSSQGSSHRGLAGISGLAVPT
ncbi:hypothetical protein lerEdw1_021045, partial [Lerista edwardsae]